MTSLWKKGFEIELIAPPGRSRADLARIVAGRTKGSVQRFFHPQAEPSKVPGTPTFENLTFGFRVVDGEGAPVASFVDDLTLKRDLDKNAPSRLEWHRIVSDDARQLQLVARHCDPYAPIERVLEPMAALYGTKLDRHPSGMCKVVDERGASICIVAVQPGDRERGCEIVTAPLTDNAGATLAFLLGEARAAGFTIPAEAALHIHFDAARLTNAGVISNLVRALARHGPALKRLVRTNPNCVRLGHWPKPLVKLAADPAFMTLDWPQALLRLKECKLTKYCDFNLLNIVHENPKKPTFEVRILPVTFEVDRILEMATLFEAILLWAVEKIPQTMKVPDTIQAFLAQLPPASAGVWLERAREAKLA
jgi:hypothetical protein